MGTSYGYYGLRSGTGLLVLFYGLCVWADGKTERTEHRAAGGSLILPLGFSRESVSFAVWKYNEKTFAVYDNGQIHITKPEKFSGRLKVNSDDLSVEVRDLQPQDSGQYSVIAEDKNKVQLPTKMISLTVYGVFSVEIEGNQTWVVSKNHCEVHLLCRMRGDHTVSYTWSGYKTGSGAELSFSLSPAEGSVTLNCTSTCTVSANTVSSNTTTVMCHPDKTNVQGKSSTDDVNMYMWIAVGGGSALLLLIAIFAVSCWWKSHKEPSLHETVYEDIDNEITMRKDKRSESINVPSIYETVDEHKISSDKPHTLYDKVTFARPIPPARSTATPYQVVL